MFTGASLPKDVLVVVRGVGERTENALVQLTQKLVEQENVVRVTGTPFSETLRKSFEVALDRNLPWTFCIDADVLLVPDALLYFRTAVQAAPSDLIGIHGLILDKLFGGVRPAGVRIYQTALLKQALLYIPHGEESKRPETFTRRAMQQKGYAWMTHGILSGLHDFEQYYRDVYRTAFFHAQKHRKYVQVLRPYWERMSQHDADFLVAIRGADHGAREERVLGLDVRNFPEHVASVLSELGLKEKQPFHQSADELIKLVQETIFRWKTPPEYDEFWRQVRQPSRVARLLGPSVLGKLGLSGVLEQ